MIAVAGMAGVALAGTAMAQSKPPAAAAGIVKPSSAVSQPQPKFVPIGFAELPGWLQDDHAAAMSAFLQSCPIIIAATKAGNKGGATPTSPAMLMVCSEAMRLGAQGVTAPLARAFFEGYFTPHRVEHGGSPGLLTGYYEPVIDGSRTPTAAFPTPVHRRPADLVNLVDESMRGAKSANLTHGRKTEGGVAPYATRAEIEHGALKGRGLEMLYLASPVDKFFMQVQGSGRIKLRDGTMVRVSYDGKNGHPYTSIGKHLIDSGKFAADKMSLQALGDWLKADLGRGRQVMELNKSYVFFRELKGEEAKGALGVLHIPLTPGRSLAVDAGFHAIGLPIYVSAPTLKHATWIGGFSRLMVAQDVGSAIKGAERGDIYFGTGDAAGKLAGNTKHPGNLIVLLPRDGASAVAKAPAVDTKKPTIDFSTGSLSQRADP
ncbi:MAG: MltA domain-containing protein [Hyphomicrobiaceae bacterium]